MKNADNNLYASMKYALQKHNQAGKACIFELIISFI